MNRGHEAVLNEFERLESVNILTTVQEVLNHCGAHNGATFTLSDARRCYRNIARQVHPDFGGVVDKARATMAMAVASRAYEQCRHASQYDAWQRAGRRDIALAIDTWDFVIPEGLLYSEQNSSEEVELHSSMNPEADEALGEEDESGESESSKDDVDDDEAQNYGLSDTEVENAVAELILREPANAPVDDDNEWDEPFTYPPFEGDEGSLLHRKYLCERSKEFRKHTRRQISKRAKQRASRLLEQDANAAATWKPQDISTYVDPVVGATFSARWECERKGRGWGAKLGLQCGVKVKQQRESVHITCGTIGCPASMKFTFQPKTTQWKCKAFISSHEGCCFGLATPAETAAEDTPAGYPSSAYQTKQIAQLILEELRENPNLNAKAAAKKVVEMNVYLRPPSERFFREVLAVAIKQSMAMRSVEMAAISGFAQLLIACGHEVLKYIPKAHVLTLTCF